MDPTDYHRALLTFQHRPGPPGANTQTCKSWRFSGKENEWDGTVFYTKDGEPSCIVFFNWAATHENVEVGLLSMIGKEYCLAENQTGHGHHFSQIRSIADQPMKLQLSLQVSSNSPDQGSS